MLSAILLLSLQTQSYRQQPIAADKEIIERYKVVNEFLEVKYCQKGRPTSNPFKKDFALIPPDGKGLSGDEAIKRLLPPWYRDGDKDLLIEMRKDGNALPRILSAAKVTSDSTGKLRTVLDVHVVWYCSEKGRKPSKVDFRAKDGWEFTPGKGWFLVYRQVMPPSKGSL